MKKAGSRILIITFGIMAAIAILYPWKFVPEYGILQMTESGEKAGKTAESQESDEEYMQVADRAVEALFTGDTDTLLSLLPERYFGQYGETLQWIIENAVEEELQKLQDEVGDIQITHWPVRSEKQSEGNMEKIKKSLWRRRRYGHRCKKCVCGSECIRHRTGRNGDSGC